MRQFGTAAALLAAICGSFTQAWATEYTCRNREFQISCSKEKCEAADGFTPMSLTMDLAKKTVEICAYTDCWRGALTTISSGKSLVAARADALRPQQTQSERENIALIIDKEHSAAAFAGFGMLTPMTCESK
jgi:hypothetical protein